MKVENFNSFYIEFKNKENAQYLKQKEASF